MVIKLFSPNAKFKVTVQHSQAATPDVLLDKPFYPISVRLLRIVDILINKYYALLVTECEIFLSLLVRFLDPDKPTWQRCLALEVLHKLITSPTHLSKFCRSYDLKPHATNICKVRTEATSNIWIMACQKPRFSSNYVTFLLGHDQCAGGVCPVRFCKSNGRHVLCITQHSCTHSSVFIQFTGQFQLQYRLLIFTDGLHPSRFLLPGELRSPHSNLPTAHA